MEKRKVGRPKKVATKSVVKEVTSVTISGDAARRFNDARLALSESGRIPFEVTNGQFADLLLTTYDNSGSSL